MDACGVCGGDGLSCIGCDLVHFSGKEVDECGVCDGESECSVASMVATTSHSRKRTLRIVAVAIGSTMLLAMVIVIGIAACLPSIKRRGRSSRVDVASPHTLADAEAVTSSQSATSSRHVTEVVVGKETTIGLAVVMVATVADDEQMRVSHSAAMRDATILHNVAFRHVLAQTSGCELAAAQTTFTAVFPHNAVDEAIATADKLHTTMLKVPWPREISHFVGRSNDSLAVDFPGRSTLGASGQSTSLPHDAAPALWNGFRLCIGLHIGHIDAMPTAYDGDPSFPGPAAESTATIAALAPPGTTAASECLLAASTSHDIVAVRIANVDDIERASSSTSVYSVGHCDSLAVNRLVAAGLVPPSPSPGRLILSADLESQLSTPNELLETTTMSFGPMVPTGPSGSPMAAQKMRIP